MNRWTLVYVIIGYNFFLVNTKIQIIIQIYEFIQILQISFLYLKHLNKFEYLNFLLLSLNCFNLFNMIILSYTQKFTIS